MSESNQCSLLVVLVNGEPIFNGFADEAGLPDVYRKIHNAILKPGEIIPAEEKDSYAAGLKDSIIQFICNYFQVERSELEGRSRVRRLAVPRSLCMFFLRKRTGMTYSEIGRIFDRDHTSVIHAINTIEDLVDSKDKILNTITDINLIMYKSV